VISNEGEAREFILKRVKGVIEKKTHLTYRTRSMQRVNEGGGVNRKMEIIRREIKRPT